MNETPTIPDNGSSRVTNAIELRGVTKRFLTPTGLAYTALRDVNFTVAPGEFVAVVGPTGCGKSTTLGLISGLERPSEGEVQVMGKPVQGIDPRIGYVFQADAVFPWKNVLNNVATGPRSAVSQKPRRWSALTIGSRVSGCRFRGPLPAPTLRRHAQARGACPDLYQRAADPADGRAVQRA